MNILRILKNPLMQWILFFQPVRIFNDEFMFEPQNLQWVVESDIPGKTENCRSAKKKIHVREKFTALKVFNLKINCKRNIKNDWQTDKHLLIK